MFGLFKKRKNTAIESPAPAPGWDAIEGAFANLYPGQTPRHWSHNGVMRMDDLKDPPENPLDGVHMYDGGSFWHYVSLGLSDLYTKGFEGAPSGFGYEFTFRLAKAGEQAPPLWPINVLVSMASAAFKGSEFAPGHTVKLGPIDGNPATKVTALLLARDPAFDLQETPNGTLLLLQLVGVEGDVRERALVDGVEAALDEIQVRNPLLVTAIR